MVVKDNGATAMCGRPWRKAASGARRRGVISGPDIYFVSIPYRCIQKVAPFFAVDIFPLLLSDRVGVHKSICSERPQRRYLRITRAPLLAPSVGFKDFRGTYMYVLGRLEMEI